MPAGDISSVSYRYNARDGDNNVIAIAGINIIEKFKIILKSLKILKYDTYSSGFWSISS